MRRAFEVFDEDAEVMQPGEVHAVVELVLLELQHRDVEMAVRQHHAFGARVVEPPHFREAENALVELRLLEGIAGGDCEVLNASHGLTPAGVVERYCAIDYS